ncbi:MAG: alanine--glyoxylate aminotransferase family protein [Methanosarcinales archaeon Met12]|nr:MAG: alanine--glyoxylate aminotransferase family protein [Methanosarcinales archaeon Met12]
MDLNKPLLMIPGPVPLHPRVLKAMSRQMINHRGPEFARIFDECVSILKDVFQTENDVLVLSGSGTAGMEAAVSNVTRGDEVVTIVNGKFGERFKEIVALYGNPIPVEYAWGSSIELDDVEGALKKGASAVTMVHNETSVGIVNPAEEVGELARKYDALFIMDGISSIGGNEVPVDKWGVDLAILGSQKCLAVPPGLAAISVSERAWERMENVNSPYYLDLKAHQKSASKGQTPYTPAIPLFFALHEALRLVCEEGLSARVKRHERCADAVRRAMNAMGLELFPRLNKISRYSNTVTAVKMPEGIVYEQLRDGIKNRGVLIAGGQEHLKGKIFRIGHMGNVSAKEILTTIEAVESTLAEHGVKAEGGVATVKEVERNS